MNTDTAELTALKAHYDGKGAQYRAMANEVESPDTGGAIDAILAADAGDVPATAAAKAINDYIKQSLAVADTRARAPLFLAAAKKYDELGAQVDAEIQRAAEAERATLKARLQAKAAEVVKAYRATFDVAVTHLAELHALADALAPHCEFSRGNCLNNETYLRPRHIDLPGGVNGVEVGTLVVTADQIHAARARLHIEGK